MYVGSRTLLMEPGASSGMSATVHGAPIDDEGSLSPMMQPRVARAMAWSRLHGALRAITIDILGPCEPQDLPDELAAWVNGAAETAATAVCERSLAALIQSLETSIALAPRGVVHQLNVAALRYNVGVVR